MRSQQEIQARLELVRQRTKNSVDPDERSSYRMEASTLYWVLETSQNPTHCPMGDGRLSAVDNPLCPQHRDMITLVEQGLQGTEGKQLRKLLTVEEDRLYRTLMSRTTATAQRGVQHV